jgi:hypothetical protein
MSTDCQVLLTDCLDWMRKQPDDSIDMTITSPPYEAARTYGIDFNLQGQAWVDWAVERFVECVRVTRGLVVWVIEGRTKNYCWSATPALFMADLHRAGIKLRKPPVYKRQGIPGSGGPDWWRNDYEFCVCASKGKLPWSDNTATGWKCKYTTGGAFSYRTPDGSRINEAKHNSGSANATSRGTRRGRPEITNPGNVLACKVGKGHMGSSLAHENEAPFPESLVSPFVVSFCPPGGRVFDPHCGSGTVAAVAVRHGRVFTGTDIRQSQIDLTSRRIDESRLTLLKEAAAI